MIYYLHLEVEQKHRIFLMVLINTRGTTHNAKKCVEISTWTFWKKAGKILLGLPPQGSECEIVSEMLSEDCSPTK